MRDHQRQYQIIYLVAILSLFVLIILVGLLVVTLLSSGRKVAFTPYSQPTGTDTPFASSLPVEMVTIPPVSTPTSLFTRISTTQVPTSTHTRTITPKPFITLSPPLAGQVQTYSVNSGESLYDIAKLFGVTVLSLMQENHIANASNIYPNQVLVIPSYGSGSEGQSSGAKRIVVDISDQKLYAFQGNQQIFAFTVSTGRGGSTWIGSFTILDKVNKAFSAPWSFWMPSWMGIYYVGEYLENGIHALPQLESGEQLWGDALGTPVSYGCVVLGPEDAEKLYNWTEIGTPVEIHD